MPVTWQVWNRVRHWLLAELGFPRVTPQFEALRPLPMWPLSLSRKGLQALGGGVFVLWGRCCKVRHTG